MELMPNPHRPAGLDAPILADVPSPSVDSDTVAAVFGPLFGTDPTPMIDAAALAAECGVGHVFVKDERPRGGLGSFKTLGAAYVIARIAQTKDVSTTTFVTASAGNHGISLAAGAAKTGAKAVIYLAETVPEAFADRLRSMGADVARAGAIYEDSLKAAEQAAADNGWVLLSDTAWPGYTELPHKVMEGYTLIMAEAGAQMPTPTHVFLQAGVGGLAGACAAKVRDVWGDAPRVVVVEPDAAPALQVAIQAGDFKPSEGPVSDMGRLDCKEASLIALKGLAKDADDFMLITEAEGQAGADAAANHGMPSTPSGAAGLAGLMAAQPADLGLDASSIVLVVLSEGPE